MNQFPETFPWERTTNGLTALREPDTPVNPRVFGRAMMVASAKMKDVCEIRADFPEQKKCFLSHI